MYGLSPKISWTTSRPGPEPESGRTRCPENSPPSASDPGTARMASVRLWVTGSPRHDSSGRPARNQEPPRARPRPDLVETPRLGRRLGDADPRAGHHVAPPDPPTPPP